MSVTPGQKRLYAGDFNVMHQQQQDDGSVILLFYRHTDNVAVQMHVSDLYGPNETVIAESSIDRSVPAHIKARQAEASQ